MALILIIDDSYLQRSTISTMVRSFGYTTVDASGGQDGLDKIAQLKPDCVLLDLLMPGIDGYTVLKHVKSNHPELPVIVVTADIQETTRQKCVELGAFDIINKPPKKEAIQDVLARCLKQRNSDT